MFGTSLAINSNGETLTLKLIKEGGNASEYLLRTATAEHKLTISHKKIKENGAYSDDPLESHQLRYTMKTFATVTTPSKETSTTVTIRNRASDVDAYIPAKTLPVFVNGKAAELIAWEV